MNEAKQQTLDSLHRVLLMMLKDFSSICEEEDISWYASFGTAIGCLRHKGFIPWDDDIDICIFRKDLDRLIKAVQEKHSDKYDMLNAQINPKYPMMTTRFLLKGTEFRDSSLATMDFDSAIFLDLFPLDNLADDERLFKRQVWRTWLYNKLAIAKLVGNPYVAGDGLSATILRCGAKATGAFLKLPGIRNIDLNGMCHSWLFKFNDDITRRVGYTCDTDRYWNIYNRDDMEPVRMVPFEDMVIPVANRIEAHLESVYGDYMTPPPPDKREAHFPEILDLGPYA